MLELPPGLHGAFDRQQLLGVLGRAGVAAAVREGRLVPHGRQVLLDRRCLADFRCRCAAALMTVGPDAVLCGHTAAVLQGCSAADSGIIHLLVGYHRQARRRLGVAVHHGNFSDGDVVRLDGLRTLVIEATVAELLCSAPRHIALGVADQAFAQVADNERAWFRGEIAARVSERADPRGRRRAEVLLALATGLPESQLESSLLLKVFDAGFPVPDAQYVVRAIDGREIWRLDFAWPELKIALEYDGYEAHEHKLTEDAARDVDLRKRGWLVVRACAADMRDPTRLFAELRAAFTARGLGV